MITKEKFIAFEDVRRSRSTNMLNTIAIQVSSDYDLSREEINEIRKNYSELAEKYL